MLAKSLPIYSDPTACRLYTKVQKAVIKAFDANNNEIFLFVFRVFHAIIDERAMPIVSEIGPAADTMPRPVSYVIDNSGRITGSPFHAAKQLKGEIEHPIYGFIFVNKERIVVR